VDEVVIGRGARNLSQHYRQGARRTLRIDVADRWMSSTHLQLLRDDSQWRLVDAGSKNGTCLNGTRLAEAILDDGDLLEAGQSFFWFTSRCPAARDRLGPVDPCETAGALATINGTLQLDFERLAQVAQSTVPLLLFGETGTGKEVVARAIHERSGRGGALVAINCGALPEALVEAELFGCRQGAYTGATESRPGLIRAADRGTLFLDEVGELPPASQVAFLRVLQQQEVVPVGETRPIPVDVRVIAATQEDLAARVDEGRFRMDLYGRLAGFELRLPPLRERREDIGLLLGRLLSRIAGERASAVRIQPAAARLLFQHDWPLNVRGLENALRSALSLAGDGRITVAHLPESLRAEVDSTQPTGAESRRRDALVAALQRHHGNISAVARDLSTSRGQVRRLCRRFGLDPLTYRS
jgi:DNA-binding NtrC family response regulator